MASDSIVRIVINAVDKYSGVLTGLNQGLELVGKGFDALKTVASVSINGITASLESLKEGGDYIELRRQFEQLATSFGQSGQEIIDVFDRVGQGTIGAAERVKLAGRAIASGLSGSEITAAVEYTKKWTEATGGDFAAMSEQVFEAFSSGRFNILKQMGLLVEKGTSASDVIKQMKTNFGLFTDTGSNVADSMGAISTAVEDFVLFAKAAIANSDYLQRALEYVAEAVRGFVKGFDFEAIGVFFDTVIKAAKIVFDAVSESFTGIGENIGQVFDYLGSLSIKDFFQALGRYSLEAYKSFAIFADAVTDSTSLVVGAFGNMIKMVGQGYQELKYLAASAIASISEVVNAGVAGWAQSILQFIASTPDIATFVPGIDKVSGALQGMITESRKSKRMFDEMRDSILTEDNVGKELEGWGEGVEAFAIALDKGRAKSKQFASDLEKNLEEGFKGFDIAERKPIISDDLIKKTSDQGKKLQEVLRAARDQQDVTEQKSADKALERQQKQADRELEQQRKNQERALRETLRAIEEIEKRSEKNSFTLLSADDSALLAQKDAIVKALKDIDDAARKTDLAVANEFLKGGEASARNIADQLNKAKIGTDSKLTVVSKQEQPQKIDVKVSGVNAPAWLQGLLDEIITQLVRAVKSERIPLVLSTYPTA
jgi:hypothetical protein